MSFALNRSTALVIVSLTFATPCESTWADALTDAQNAAQLAQAQSTKAQSDLATAQAQASLANLAASTAQSQTESEIKLKDAQLTYYKSLIPDLSAAKASAPNAPKLDATIAMMAALDARVLGKKISTKVANASFDYLVVNMGVISQLIEGYGVTLDTLQEDITLLDFSTSSLNKLVAESKKSVDPSVLAQLQGKATKSQVATNVTPVVVAAAVQAAVNVVAALKPDFKFATADAKDTFGNLVQAEVLKNFSGKFLEPGNMLITRSATQTAQTYKTYQDLLRAISDARTANGVAKAQIAKLNLELIAAGVADTGAKEKGESKPATAAAGGAPVDTKKVSAQDVINAKKKADIDAMTGVAQALSDAADRATALATSVITVDKTAGISPLQSAVRGELLDQRVASKSTYVLKLTPVSSNYDTVVKDGFFSGLHIWISGTSTVKWELYDNDGLLKLAGTEFSDGDAAPRQINLDAPDSVWNAKKAKEDVTLKIGD